LARVPGESYQRIRTFTRACMRKCRDFENKSALLFSRLAGSKTNIRSAGQSSSERLSL
jgi:hypothetical protein